MSAAAPSAAPTEYVRPKPRHLKLQDSKVLKRLPAGTRCATLDVSNTPLTELPADLTVRDSLRADNCTGLQQLPDDLTVGSLRLRGCTALTELPEGLSVGFLDLTGCTAFRRWPRRLTVRGGALTLRGCTALDSLPEGLGPLATLDVSGCTNLTSLPEGLKVAGWVDVGDSGLTGLPAPLTGVQLRWRGVRVSAQEAFFPETIRVVDVLAERNTERRRVLLTRVGYERFYTEAKPQVRDSDRDPGGPRRLLVVPWPDDEDVVCLQCKCPSTGRDYLLRVPPATKTCHAAAAWLAGFDDPADYQPAVEA